MRDFAGKQPSAILLLYSKDSISKKGIWTAGEEESAETMLRIPGDGLDPLIGKYLLIALSLTVCVCAGIIYNVRLEACICQHMLQNT